MPHIHRHGVYEDDVREVVRKPGEDRPGYNGARVALGQTSSGRYLRVVYVIDDSASGLFVITAFPLTGKWHTSPGQRPGLALPPDQTLRGVA